MTNSALGKVFDTLLNAINLFRFWIVLDPFEQGIILRLGEFHREVGPGFHWRRAFNVDRLLWLNVRKKTRDSWEMTLTSKDNKPITMSFDMIVEVVNAKKALLAVDSWTSVAYTTSKIMLSQIVANTNASCINGSDFAKKVHNTINLVVQNYGVEVTEFGLTDMAQSKAYRVFTGASK